MISELEMPTVEEFDAELGAPVLTFTLDQTNVLIPTGPPHCCRVVHQTQCLDHVARTLVGCEIDIRLPDGSLDARVPFKQTFEGDVLARPLDFSAAVQTVAILASTTAEALGGRVERLEFNVWTLNLEQAAIWDLLLQREETEAQNILEQTDQHSTAWIESLPIVVLDQDTPAQAAQVMGRPSFRHIQAYARKVLVLPHEIGHDDRARYVTSILGGRPGEVPPAVDAILQEPDA